MCDLPRQDHKAGIPRIPRMMKPGQRDPCAKFGVVALMAESRGEVGGGCWGEEIGVCVLHLLEWPA